MLLNLLVRAMPGWLKTVILKSVIIPMDARGYVFSMRQKIQPAWVTKEIERMRSRSLCSFTHFDAAWRAMDYVEENNIPGDIVLCGVAKGGLAKFMYEHLLRTNGNRCRWPGERQLWLYDMFDGGTLPGDNDSQWERENGPRIKSSMAVNLKAVKFYVEPDGLGLCKWVVGDVLKTIPEHMPTSIALLYLDTDYYESTRHELLHLEPRVTEGGVIIQDDMGLCKGAARAVAEHYETKSKFRRPFIIPLDEAGAVWVKRV